MRDFFSEQGLEVQELDLVIEDLQDLEAKMQEHRPKYEKAQGLLKSGFLGNGQKQRKLDPRQEEAAGKRVRQFEGWEQKLGALQQKQFELCVQLRCNFAEDRLRQDLARISGWAQRMEVHFVSNNHCKASTEKQSFLGPCLPLERTGIPGLRRYVHKAVASNMLQAMETWVTADFPAFVHGLRIYANPTELKGSKEALGIMQKQLKKIPDTVETSLRQITGKADSILLRPTDSDQARDTQVNTALRELSNLRKWNHGTIRVFVNRDGQTTSAHREHQSWNEGFSQDIIDSVNADWSKFRESNKPDVTALQKSLKCIMSSIEKDFDNSSMSGAPQLQQLKT
jgi:hypothetical protein